MPPILLRRSDKNSFFAKRGVSPCAKGRSERVGAHLEVHVRSTFPGRERHPCLDGQRRATERFRRQLFDEACERPFSEIAVEHRVSFYRVIEAFDDHSTVAVEAGATRVLAMDESSIRKRFVFQTVLFDPLARRGLAISDGRNQRSTQELLRRRTAKVRAGVETVVIDCHRPVWQAIREALPDARIVADTFHVHASIDRAATGPHPLKLA